MSSSCPNCGFKLVINYKYCPECGIKLKSASNDSEIIEENQNVSPRVTTSVICDICGEENIQTSSICAGCGGPLKGELIKKEFKEDTVVTPQLKEIKKSGSSEKGYVRNPSKKDVKEQKPIGSNQTKKLNPKYLTWILILVFALAALLIISSGVFDGSPETNLITNQETEHNHSTVDLNNINLISQLEEQLQSRPNDPELLIQLANLQTDSRLFDRAISNYKKYLTILPKNPDARIDLGVCYYNIGLVKISEGDSAGAKSSFKDAITEMEKALTYSPNHQIGHLNLGVVNLTAGNLEKSREWLKKAIELDPNSDAGRRAQELLKSH
ncbi:MAG: tetratricopeptide repeat protein [Ignavibacteriaceae bacterium]|nr:tetratricopeptide repeat protein [Ignavibacteriaceae bacterium]